MKRFIAVESIKIAPNRQRKVFAADKLQALSDSIATIGLMHAPIFRVVGDSYQLVAGERRVRAMTDLCNLGTSFTYDGERVPSGVIPYTLLSDLDELAAEEAELEENIQREDLTWQERAEACARLSNLRSRQATASGEKPPTVADIALEIRGRSEGINQETTRRELIVARHLDNPEVKAAKSVDEAFKVLKKQEQATKVRELGASVGRTFTAEAHRALNEDSLQWMQNCEAEVFDCILTDPPYGMGADEFGDSGGLAAGAHGYEDTLENALTCYQVLATEGFRITKPQAHLYAFCDIDVFPTLKTMFGAAGWQVFRTPLLWYKKHGSRAPWPELGPQRKYETILYAIKGKRPILKMIGDVLDYPADTNLGHAAQKPVALYEDLLRRTCLPGNTVLDPFCGTGPIFPAAHGLKIRATGIEKDQASYGIGVRRIQELSAEPELAGL